MPTLDEAEQTLEILVPPPLHLRRSVAASGGSRPGCYVWPMREAPRTFLFGFPCLSNHRQAELPGGTPRSPGRSTVLQMRMPGRFVALPEVSPVLVSSSLQRVKQVLWTFPSSVVAHVDVAPRALCPGRRRLSCHPRFFLSPVLPPASPVGRTVPPVSALSSDLSGPPG